MTTYGWGGSTRGLGTLIAVIMRYPEVGSVQCDPEAKALQVTFVVRGPLSEETWAKLQEQTYDVLASYRQITGRPLKTLTMSASEVGELLSIELTRDTDTVSVEEIGMFIEVLRDHFNLSVLADPHDLLEEEMLVQEETIQERLAAVVQHGSGQVVALREEGRVLIFNT